MSIPESRKLSITLALSVALLLAIPAAASAATTFNVNSTVDAPQASPGSTCVSTADGTCTLRAAIQATNNVGSGLVTINVPAGTYKLTIAPSGPDSDATGDLNVETDGSLDIVGAGAATTIVDGNFLDRVFQIGSTSTVSISGMTIKNGRPGGLGNTNACPAQPSTDADGGGVLTFGPLSLSDDTLSGNIAPGDGGGLADEAQGGQVTVTNSTFASNTACGGTFSHGNGGGIVHAEPFSAFVRTAAPTAAGITIDSSTITHNTAAGDGGGVTEDAPPLTMSITKSTISNNKATRSGGGIAAEFGDGTTATVTLFADLVSANTAADGGGILANAFGTATDTTVTENTATGIGGGGGVENGCGDCGSMQLSFDTVYANKATGGDGGNLGTGGPQGFGDLDFDNSIVAAGTPNDCGANAGGYVSIGNDLLDSSSDPSNICGADASHGDIVTTDPKVGSLKDNLGPTKTEALLLGSPAIDGASDSDCASETKDSSGKTVDQRFITRPQGPHCDIGAFEATPDVGVTGSVDHNPIFTGQQDTVTWVVGNSSPADAENVIFTDPGAANFRIESVHSSRGSCTHKTKTVKCLLGLIAPGGHVTITVVVTGLTTGKITLHAFTSTSGTDLDQANNHASVSITVKTKKKPPPPPPKPKADPAITDSVSPGHVMVGGSFTYTLVVTNNGPDADTHVVATDRLPKGVSFQSVSSGRGHCSQSGGTVTCALGKMASGAGTKIRIKVKGVDVGRQTDAAKVKGAVHDTDTGNNHAHATAVVVAPPPPPPPPGKPSIGIGQLHSACYAESSTVRVTVTVRAPAGIRRVVVKLAGKTLKTYTPAGHPTSKKLHLAIQGPSLLAGRTYTLGAFMVDTLGRQAHAKASFTMCKTKPKRGFTG